MNERINQLFSKALDEAIPETWTTLDTAQLSRLREKFAKLIVRECMEVTVNYPHPVTQLTAAEHIARHFGVEK